MVATQEAGGRAARTHGHSTAGVILRMIEDGEVDEYLKCIVDSIKERKFALELSGGIPGQKTAEAIDQSMTGSATFDPTPTANAAPAAPSTKGVGKPRFYARQARPEADMIPFSGTINPLTKDEQQSRQDGSMITLNGFTYCKSDLVGKCVQAGSYAGVHDLRLKIIGVGPKALKVLIVNEPNDGDLWNGKPIKDRWLANEPIFAPHVLIDMWLNRPSNNINDYI